MSVVDDEAVMNLAEQVSVFWKLILIFGVVFAPIVYVLYSQAVFKSKSSLAKCFWKGYLIAIVNFIVPFLVFMTVFYLVALYSNNVYALLDIGGKIPLLTYTVVEGSLYPETTALSDILAVFAVFMSFLTSYFSLTKFANDTAVKVSDSVFATLRHVVLNWRFWLGSIVLGLILLLCPYMLISTTVWGLCLNVLFFIGLFAFLPFIVKRLFADYLTLNQYALKQKMVWTLVLIIVGLVVAFLLTSLHKTIYANLQSQMPAVVRENRQLKNDLLVENNVNEQSVVAQAEALVNKYSKNYVPYAFLGEYYFSMKKDNENGIKYTRKAVDLVEEPITWVAYYTLLDAYKTKGEYNLDLAYKSLKQHPRSLVALHVYDYYKNTKDLKGMFEKVEHYDFATLYVLYLKLSEAELYEQALAVCPYIEQVLHQEMLAGGSSSFSVPKEQVLMRQYFMLNDKLDGLFAPKLFSSSELLNKCYALAYIGLGEYEQAQKHIKKLKKNTVERLQCEFTLLMAQKKYNDAERLLSSLVSSQVSSVNVKKMFLELYLETDLNKFEKYYNRLPKKDKKNIKIKVLYAEFLNKKGEYKKALEHLRELENKSDNWSNLRLQRQLAKAYSELNDKQKAEEYKAKIRKIEDLFENK